MYIKKSIVRQLNLPGDRAQAKASDALQEFDSFLDQLSLEGTARRRL